MSSYRMVVTYSEERKVFAARVPELEGCEAEAETRVEAVSRLEEEMAAQIENIKALGVEPPVPIDLQQFDGQLSLKVTPELHRDLVFLARMAKVELDALLVELLVRGVAGPGSRGAGPQRQRPEGGRRQGGQQGGQQGRYHDIMENRADFIEYVRRLEGGGGGRSGGRGGGRGGRR